MSEATTYPRSRALAKLSLVAAAGAAGVVVLFFFDPSAYGIFPRCIVHQFSGLACPGCGGLRAVHQLAHGNFAAALHQNPLIFVLLPVLGWLVVREYSRDLFGRRLPPDVIRPAWVWTAFAIMLVFTIARNLPFESVRWLGPQ